jgi:hypothetical protein
MHNPEIKLCVVEVTRDPALTAKIIHIVKDEIVVAQTLTVALVEAIDKGKQDTVNKIIHSGYVHDTIMDVLSDIRSEQGCDCPPCTAKRERKAHVGT